MSLCMHVCLCVFVHWCFTLNIFCLWVENYLSGKEKKAYNFITDLKFSLTFDNQCCNIHRFLLWTKHRFFTKFMQLASFETRDLQKAISCISLGINKYVLVFMCLYYYHLALSCFVFFDLCAFCYCFFFKSEAFISAIEKT